MDVQRWARAKELVDEALEHPRRATRSCTRRVAATIAGANPSRPCWPASQRRRASSRRPRCAGRQVAWPPNSHGVTRDAACRRPRLPHPRGPRHTGRRSAGAGRGGSFCWPSSSWQTSWRLLVLDGRFTPVTDHRPGAPPGWQDFFARALAVDRGRRPHSAMDPFRNLELALDQRAAASPMGQRAS
jgi:hypothetical protein